jgi:phage terminase Nu1 subunit (DNA packaging protein)
MADKEPSEIWISSKQANEIFHLTPRRLHQLANEGHIPKARRGKWELLGVAGGLTRYYRLQLDKGSKKLDEESRLKSAQANLRELEYQKARGQLLERSTVEGLLIETVTAMKGASDAVPSRVSVDCVGKNARQIKAILTDEIRAFQTEFAARLAELAGGIEGIIKARRTGKAATAGPVGGRRKNTTKRTRRTRTVSK